MGRPYKGEPFQVLVNGERTGSYKVYDPNEGKVISLGTQDLSEAKRIVQEKFGGLLGKVVPKGGKSVKNLKDTSEVSSVKHSQVTADALVSNAPATSAAPTGHVYDDGIQALKEWFNKPDPAVTQKPLPFNEVKSNETPTADFWKSTESVYPATPAGGTVSHPTAPAFPSDAPVLPVAKSGRGKGKKPGWSPEQAEKLGTIAQKMIARLNVAGIEACVRYLGRDPYPLDDDDLELLATGWEMFLSEYFVKKPPEPWMLILAGNLLCGFQAYAQGNPIKKEIAPSSEAPKNVTPMVVPR